MFTCVYLFRGWCLLWFISLVCSYILSESLLCHSKGSLLCLILNYVVDYSPCLLSYPSNSLGKDTLRRLHISHPALENKVLSWCSSNVCFAFALLCPWCLHPSRLTKVVNIIYNINPYWWLPVGGCL